MYKISGFMNRSYDFTVNELISFKYEYLYTTVVSYQTRNALKWTMKKIFLNVTATKSNGKMSETLS
jgi:hypothetical protein